MQRRNFFKSLAASISDADKKEEIGKEDKRYVEESVLEDPFFHLAKKIISRKESKALLEEIIIDEMTTLEKADGISPSPPLSSDELMAAFKPIIPKIHAFLDAGPV